MSDTRWRELVRQVATTGDPSAAGSLLVEAVRTGRWLTSRADGGDWNDNSHRIGTLRFLAYLGWGGAEDLLASLPLEHAGLWSIDPKTGERVDAFYPIREHRAYATPFGEIGPDVAKMIAPTVLAAASGAACMTVRHLMPATFDAQEALTVYGNMVKAWREYITEVRRPGSPPSSRVRAELHEAEQAAMREALRVEVSVRPGFDTQRDMQEREPAKRAIYSAREAWAHFLGAPRRHESDQAEQYAEVLFWATYALAWEREPKTELPTFYSAEWHAIPDSHWSRAHRPRQKWGDKYGAKVSVGCMRGAKAKLRDAMRGPALVAAATLVS